MPNENNEEEVNNQLAVVFTTAAQSLSANFHECMSALEMLVASLIHNCVNEEQHNEAIEMFSKNVKTRLTWHKKH